jgi:hypothetical protein
VIAASGIARFDGRFVGSNQAQRTMLPVEISDAKATKIRDP